jgi:ABC-2 type transport system ATP-binding protein
MNDGAAMLEAVALTKRYDGQAALDSLDLRIEPGEVFCLLGANGAGKTTTINLFLNFIEPTSGAARIDGLDVTERPLETKRRLAYIPEQVMLYRNLTGIENLEYFATLAGRKDLSRRDLQGYLEAAGLPAQAADRRVSVYSKGMRQKVGIAVALAKRAKALLLDEPTSGLDPAAANEFTQIVRRLAEEGAAVLMTTHDLFNAKQAGTRVGIMKQGRLVDQRRTAEVGHSELERIYLDHARDCVAGGVGAS